MEMRTVKLLFRLFSGVDIETETEYVLIVEMAVTEVEKMLKEGADSSDIRLCYLSAALANYRYRQIICGQDRTEVTYAGKMSRAEHDISLEYAEKMFRDYVHLCEDIIVSSDFVFMAFGTEGGCGNA